MGSRGRRPAVSQVSVFRPAAVASATLEGFTPRQGCLFISVATRQGSNRQATKGRLCSEELKLYKL